MSTSARLERPQKTLYGIHRPARFARTDPHAGIQFADPAPTLQRWELIAWAFIVGFCSTALLLV